MTNVRLRDARPDDAAALHALYQAAYAPGGDPHRPPETAFSDSVDDVRSFIEEGRVLVAEDAQGRLVGSVMIRGVANIRRLAVAPDRKREGLAGAILEASLARAKSEGYAWADLDTIPTHPWLSAFYRKHGFVDRCVARFASGVEWLHMRRRL